MGWGVGVYRAETTNQNRPKRPTLKSGRNDPEQNDPAESTLGRNDPKPFAKGLSLTKHLGILAKNIFKALAPPNLYYVDKQIMVVW